MMGGDSGSSNVSTAAAPPTREATGNRRDSAHGAPGIAELIAEYEEAAGGQLDAASRRELEKRGRSRVVVKAFTAPSVSSSGFCDREASATDLNSARSTRDPPTSQRAIGGHVAIAGATVSAGSGRTSHTSSSTAELLIPVASPAPAAAPAEAAVAPTEAAVSAEAAAVPAEAAAPAGAAEAAGAAAEVAGAAAEAAAGPAGAAGSAAKKAEAAEAPEAAKSAAAPTEAAVPAEAAGTAAGAAGATEAAGPAGAAGSAAEAPAAAKGASADGVGDGGAAAAPADGVAGRRPSRRPQLGLRAGNGGGRRGAAAQSQQAPAAPPPLSPSSTCRQQPTGPYRPPLQPHAVHAAQGPPAPPPGFGTASALADPSYVHILPALDDEPQQRLYTSQQHWPHPAWHQQQHQQQHQLWHHYHDVQQQQQQQQQLWQQQRWWHDVEAAAAINAGEQLAAMKERLDEAEDGRRGAEARAQDLRRQLEAAEGRAKALEAQLASERAARERAKHEFEGERRAAGGRQRALEVQLHAEHAARGRAEAARDRLEASAAALEKAADQNLAAERALRDRAEQAEEQTRRLKAARDEDRRLIQELQRQLAALRPPAGPDAPPAADAAGQVVPVVYARGDKTTAPEGLLEQLAAEWAAAGEGEGEGPALRLRLRRAGPGSWRRCARRSPSSSDRPPPTASTACPVLGSPPPALLPPPPPPPPQPPPFLPLPSPASARPAPPRPGSTARRPEKAAVDAARESGAMHVVLVILRIASDPAKVPRPSDPTIDSGVGERREIVRLVQFRSEAGLALVAHEENRRGARALRELLAAALELPGGTGPGPEPPRPRPPVDSV
eukprot:tig00000042_g15613.t1